MTSDDQLFIDWISSASAAAARYTNSAADFVDKLTDSLAVEIRHFIDKAETYIPPAPANGPSVRAFHRAPPPRSFVRKASDWVSEHRTAVAVIVAFSGTTAFLLYRRRREERRKRRAKRTLTGAKKEVVVLATTVHDPLSRSLATDLERRGYIVYVTVSSQSEHDLLERGPDAKADIRPLWIDLTSSVPNTGKDIHPNLIPIHDLITKTQVHNRGNGFAPHKYLCSLAGIILMPATDSSKSSLSLLHAHDMVDTVNTRLLSPMLVVKQFLPMLTDVTHPTSIIVAYPSIPSSLNPPLQAVLSATTSALSSFTRSLRSELLLLQRPNAQPVQVTEVKIGNLDLGTTPTFSKSQNASDLEAASQNGSPSPRSAGSHQALPWHWHSSQRAEMLRRTYGQVASSVRGSPVRTFHNAMFDTLYATRYLQPASEQNFATFLYGLPVLVSNRGPGGVVYAGRGAWVYDKLSSSSLIPRSLVDTLVRLRCSKDGWGPEIINAEKGTRAIPLRSRSGSPGSGSDGYIGRESSVWERV